MKSLTTLLGGAALISLSTQAFAQQAATGPTQTPVDPTSAGQAPVAVVQPAAPTATNSGSQNPQSPSVQPSQPAQSDSNATQSSDDDTNDEDAIVVNGQRPRGSVIGDIPPTNVLDARDVHATGATNINDLLDALAPQIGSTQGRGGEQPVVLLNGERVSSFRELRDIPTEAIERVEILPEEVSLKYGYRPDQKVVNIVLRQRFRSTTAQIGLGASTDGGDENGNIDLTSFSIQKNGRTTLNLHATGNDLLSEAQRNILLTQPPPTGESDEDELEARSLLPSKRDVRAGSTFNRQILGDVSATLNTEVEHTDGLALVGLGDTLLEALARNTSTDTAHAGVTMNGNKFNWRWTFTSNADFERDFTGTDLDQPNAVPDRALETTETGDMKATANGKLFSLPAGDASSTVTLAGTTVHLESERRLQGATDSNSLDRTTGEVAANIDLPISRRNRSFSALGNLTFNGNVEVDHLSDFGILTTIGVGANWSPVDRLNFIASWTREQGPPTINQLGDPLIETPGTRIFDFTTGQTVLATAISGGNPDLQSDLRHVVKISGNWQPFKNTDLKLRAEYVHQIIANPIANLLVTPTIEEAFPDRFVRNSMGQLVSVDLRPVNFQRSQTDTMRVGFDFSQPLKSHRPSRSVIDEIREQFRSRAAGASGRQGAQSANPPSGASSSGEAPPAAPAGQNETSPPGGRGPRDEGGTGGGGGAGGPGGGSGGGGRFGGRGGGGGFFGGGNRGRLTFSLTDTITFVSKVQIGTGLPVVDYLHGDAAGATGGTPRHLVQAQGGYFNNGLGARLVANWRTGTTVDSLTGDNLHFSPLATFDLKLFANPGDIPELTVKHPWFRGTQIQLQLVNMFNSRPQVHDSAGKVPISYQPDLLDPLGRTIMLSFRKLFLPSPNWLRHQFQDMRQQQGRSAS